MLEVSQKPTDVIIHVECILALVWLKFTILQRTQPIKVVETKDDTNIPMLNKAVSICCTLTNLYHHIGCHAQI